MRLFWRLVANIIALWLATELISGVFVDGGLEGLIIAGRLLGLFNLIIRPILKLLATPIVFLTLGLFSLVINGLLVYAVDYLLDFVTIQSLGALIWATILITLINMIAGSATKKSSRKSDDH